tara:strand:+ start:647 stop:922 length:276 start_codon:yes stop_codon:yes gene_type:complete
MIKVFFIAKIKDFNDEYEKVSQELREMAETLPGFISITSEEIDDVEITISSWRSKEDVANWAKDPVHIEAKKKAKKWYHWVKGIHVEAIDE